jgi:hypothetical protein
MANLAAALKYLEQERNRLGAQLERLNHALARAVGCWCEGDIATTTAA